MSKKKILLTGALGQLGRAIQRVYKDEVEFIKTDVVEAEGVSVLDITDADAVEKIVSDNQIDVIINCAAFTNVDGCETQEDLAYNINANGPKNLAVSAKNNNAKLIHVSTDYVFAGDGDRPYVEADEPAPVSAYGRTKLAGEQFVQSCSDKYFILRTAWLYGEGHNFVKTMLKLSENHDEVSVVMDQLGTPTSAMELARMIHALEATELYGIYHATCEGDTNWATFAEAIFKKAGKSTKVNYVTSAQYKEMNPKSANRPAYSILENAALKEKLPSFSMAMWEDALDEYMKEYIL